MKSFKELNKTKIIIWGYSLNGVKVLKLINSLNDYEFLGYADNSKYKQGYYVQGKQIYDLEGLIRLREKENFSVIIAVSDWKSVRDDCLDNQLPIEAVFMNNEIHHYPFPRFETLDYSNGVRLYAGDICDDIHKSISNLFGLSIHTEDSRHILHDIRNPYPIEDNCIISYEAEDVFEYIEKERHVDVINEIYRILRPGAYARFCLPDYNSPWVKNRVMRDSQGSIVYDAGGGGDYGCQGVIDGGEVYFATYEDFNETLLKTRFNDIRWGCFFSEDGFQHRYHFDMSLGYVNRLSDEVDAYSMLVDCWK